MEEIKQIPVYYLYLYRKIKKKTNGNKYILYSSLMEVLNRTIFNVPHTLHYEIIKEMEKYSLLKKIDAYRYEIIGGQADRYLNQFNLPF